MFRFTLLITLAVLLALPTSFWIAGSRLAPVEQVTIAIVLGIVYALVLIIVNDYISRWIK